MKRSETLKIIPMVFFIAACAGTSKHESDAPDALPKNGQTGIPLNPPELSPINQLTYTVKPGDSLSAIAKQTTGNGDNWYKIAQYNGIENPGSINVGDQIEIPSEMLRASLRSQLDSEQATEQSNTNDDKLQAEISPPKQTGQSPDSLLVSDTSEIDSTATNTSQAAAAVWVVVDGSYYPKAIYEQPGYTGNLQSRVSPGTTLELLSEIDDWVEVRTKSGSGYIHQSDVRRISSLAPDNHSANNI